MIKLGTKAPTAWAILLCSGVLFAFLFFRMTPREPWTFVVGNYDLPIRGDLKLHSASLNPVDEKDFVHGASVIATPTGLLAFWYRAVYEGAGNAELVSASFDGKSWSPTHVVTNSKTVTRDAGVTFKSVANPVPFRRSANEIWLFFAASRLSGWATCEIMLMKSFDNGLTWGPAERLYASPFLNISHLTKSPPVRLSGGLFALPAYHELGTKYPVMFILNGDGRIIDRRRMGDGGLAGLQPSIVPTSPTSAVALVRRLTDHRPGRVLITRTTDAGQTWSPVSKTTLQNPGGAISAIRYDGSHILLAYNDDPKTESNITVAISDLAGTHWRRIGIVALQSRYCIADRVMYPYIIQSQPGQFDVVYSRVIKSIGHVRFSSAWVEHALQTEAVAKLDTMQK